MAHIHYLHSGTFGNQQQPEIRDMTCSSTAYGVDASFRLHNKPVNALWDFSKARPALGPAKLQPLRAPHSSVQPSLPHSSARAPHTGPASTHPAARRLLSSCRPSPALGKWVAGRPCPLP